MRIGRSLLTLSLIAACAGPILADWNDTHVFNPEWPPHARFHDVTGLSMTAGTSAIALWLLWRKSSKVVTSLVIATAIPLLACSSLFVAMLVPGTDVEDHPGETPRVWGLPLGPFLASVCSAIAVLGSILCFRVMRAAPKTSGTPEPSA